MMRSKCAPALLSVALVTALLAGPMPASKASTVLVFGQNGVSNTTVVTANVGGTATTITNTNTGVTISGIDPSSGLSTPLSAFFNLNATSTSTAVLVGSPAAVEQHFSGSFSFSSGLNGTGTNYLSGTFIDLVTGKNGGNSLTLEASSPPAGAVTLTSSVMGPLLDPRAIALSFANVSTVGITGSTLSSASASVSGDFSATVAPEPATIVTALSALPVLGLMLARRRKRA